MSPFIPEFNTSSLLSYFLGHSSQRFVNIVDLFKNQLLVSLIFFIVFLFSISFISIQILLLISISFFCCFKFSLLFFPRFLK